MNAPSWFEFVERAPNLDLVEWEDPNAITVVERQLTPEEFERMRQMFEVSL